MRFPRETSSIPRQLAPSPMMFLGIGIEHPLDVPVRRLHDADTREHRRALHASSDFDSESVVAHLERWTWQLKP